MNTFSSFLASTAVSGRRNSAPGLAAGEGDPDASDLEDLLILGADEDEDEGRNCSTDETAVGLPLGSPSEVRSQQPKKQHKKRKEDPPLISKVENFEPTTQRSLLADEFEPKRPSLSLLLKGSSANTSQHKEANSVRRNARSFGDATVLAAASSTATTATSSTNSQRAKRSSHHGDAADKRKRAGSSNNVDKAAPEAVGLDVLRLRGLGVVVMGLGASSVTEAAESNEEDSDKSAVLAPAAESCDAGTAKPVLDGDTLHLRPAASNAGLGDERTGSRHSGTSIPCGPSSGSDYDLEVDEACLWSITQMLGGTTVGDLIRGLVKLCNLKRGASFCLLAPWTPRPPRNSTVSSTLAAGPPAFSVLQSSSSGAESDTGHKQRLGYSSSSEVEQVRTRKARLTPLKQQSDAPFRSNRPSVSGDERKTVSSDHVGTENASGGGQQRNSWSSRSVTLGAAVTASSTAPPATALAPTASSSSLEVLDLGDGRVAVPSGVDPSRVLVDAISGFALPAPATAAPPISSSALPPSFPRNAADIGAVASISQGQCQTTSYPLASPLHFDLWVCDSNGDVDDDFPALERTMRVKDVGESHFALVYNQQGDGISTVAKGTAVLEIKVQAATSSKGAEVLFISFRRPKSQWRAIYPSLRGLGEAGPMSPGSSASRTAGKAVGRKAQRGRGGAHSKGGGVLSKLLDSASSVGETEDDDDEGGDAVHGASNAAGLWSGFAFSRGPAAASLRELDAETDDSSDEDVKGRAGRQGGKSGGNDEDISFEAWYQREYGGQDDAQAATSGDAAGPVPSEVPPAGSRQEPSNADCAAGIHACATDAAASGTVESPPAAAPPAPSSLPGSSTSSFFTPFLRLFGSRTVDAAAQRRQEQRKKQQLQQENDQSEQQQEQQDKKPEAAPVSALSRKHGSGLRLQSMKARREGNDEDAEYAADVEAAPPSTSSIGPSSSGGGRRSRGNSGSGALPPPLPLSTFTSSAKAESSAIVSASTPAEAATSKIWTPRVFFGSSRSTSSRAGDALRKQQEKAQQQQPLQTTGTGSREVVPASPEALPQPTREGGKPQTSAPAVGGFFSSLMQELSKRSSSSSSSSSSPSAPSPASTAAVAAPPPSPATTAAASAEPAAVETSAADNVMAIEAAESSAAPADSAPAAPSAAIHIGTREEGSQLRTAEETTKRLSGGGKEALSSSSSVSSSTASASLATSFQQLWSSAFSGDSASKGQRNAKESKASAPEQASHPVPGSADTSGESGNASSGNSDGQFGPSTSQPSLHPSPLFGSAPSSSASTVPPDSLGPATEHAIGGSKANANLAQGSSLRSLLAKMLPNTPANDAEKEREKRGASGAATPAAEKKLEERALRESSERGE